MYSNKFVVALKTVDGKVLREQKDTTFLPFGSEYSIYLKNLNSVRSQVKVSVDGQDVLNGESLVINANQDLNLERFLKSKDSGNRFKFIERTSQIENHRGVKTEDGLIRIEFQFEKVLTNQWYVDTRLGGGYNPGQIYNGNGWGGAAGGSGGNQIYTKGFGGSPLNAVGSSYSMPAGQANCMDFSLQSTEIKCSAPVSDVGITVPGSISDQKFQTVSGFTLESEVHVIVLKLLGETDTVKIVEPITVKAKPTCVSCGRVNKANSKFCTNCGTSLTIV
jgi:hypothetical protein